MLPHLFKHLKHSFKSSIEPTHQHVEDIRIAYSRTEIKVGATHTSQSISHVATCQWYGYPMQGWLK